MMYHYRSNSSLVFERPCKLLESTIMAHLEGASMSCNVGVKHLRYDIWAEYLISVITRNRLYQIH